MGFLDELALVYIALLAPAGLAVAALCKVARLSGERHVGLPDEILLWGFALPRPPSSIQPLASRSTGGAPTVTARRCLDAHEVRPEGRALGSTAMKPV